jgi:hypothetical protein
LKESFRMVVGSDRAERTGELVGALYRVRKQCRQRQHDLRVLRGILDGGGKLASKRMSLTMQEINIGPDVIVNESDCGWLIWCLNTLVKGAHRVRRRSKLQAEAQANVQNFAKRKIIETKRNRQGLQNGKRGQYQLVCWHDGVCGVLAFMRDVRVA